jgi:hypothetical protein
MKDPPVKDPPMKGPPMKDIAKLARTELRLVLREPLVLTFVFAFPVVTVVVIAGCFGTHANPGFAGTKPSQWYVSSYLAVVIAAIGLVMVPVHVAGYRERGVLRRFASAGFPRWSFAVAQVATGVVLTFAASAVLLAVAGAVYGLPPIESPLRVVAGIVVGAVAFTSLGLLIGAWMPNARAAPGVGLLLFFPLVPAGRRRAAPVADGLDHAQHRQCPAPHPRHRLHPQPLAGPRLRKRGPGAGRTYPRGIKWSAGDGPSGSDRLGESGSRSAFLAEPAGCHLLGRT